MKKEVYNSRLPFLGEILMTRINKKIITDEVYRKPTRNGNCSSFQSNQPMETKLEIAKSLIHRVKEICNNKKILKKKFQNIKKDLKTSNCPIYNLTKLPVRTGNTRTKRVYQHPMHKGSL